MKQFINAHILCFVLILLQFSLFSSCKDDDTVGELKLDRAAIQIKEGSEGILKVENGSGGYQFSFSDEGYASAKYRENLIYIKGEKYGKVTMKVTDMEGHIATLDIVIVSKVLNTDTQRFVWGDMIELNKANNWAITQEVCSIAVTNLMEGKQFILSWDGDSSVGGKDNAKLLILSNQEAEEPQELILAGMEILQIKDGLCSVVFSTDEKVGELVFIQ